MPQSREDDWTTHDDGRQPIAIGHLSDSGDLKNCIWCLFQRNKTKHIYYTIISKVSVIKEELASIFTLCKNASCMSDAKLAGEWVVPMTTTGYSMYSFLSLTTQVLKVPATLGSS